MNLPLTPDRNLLDPNFESYKLSLDSLAVFSTALSVDLRPQCRSPAPDQYSYHHAKLFGRANLLVLDPECQDRIYLLDPERDEIFVVRLEKNEPEAIKVSEQ